MLQILLGTRNKHKQREIRNILRRLPVRWLDLNKFSYGISKRNPQQHLTLRVKVLDSVRQFSPIRPSTQRILSAARRELPSEARPNWKAPRIKEDGKSYRANALKKARGFARATGKIVLAEDSGLEVKRLAGKPGIYSARYSGPKATARSNNLKLLKALQGVALTKRQAQYRCVVVLAAPRKILAITEGICRGYIADRLKGRQGFGYDPLFVVPKYHKTFGQLPNSVKNRISHRAVALNRMKSRLRQIKVVPRFS